MLKILNNVENFDRRIIRNPISDLMRRGSRLKAISFRGNEVYKSKNNLVVKRKNKAEKSRGKSSGRGREKSYSVTDRGFGWEDTWGKMDRKNYRGMFSSIRKVMKDNVIMTLE